MTFQTVEQLQAEIASLTAEIERLREALERIYGDTKNCTHSGDGHVECREIARVTLQPKEGV